MIRKAMFRLSQRLRDEKGQALIMVLVLLMIGSLTLPPVLSHIGTALKTGRMYDNKANEFYAADSGIEDAIWQVKYDRLGVLFDDPEYDTYDFDSTWSYDLDEPINGLTVNVTIQNIWIPKNVTPPVPADARDIIESGKLVVAGTAPTDTSYRIKIDFYPGEGEEGDLFVDSLGIWLPLGFSYVAGSSNLEEDPFEEYYSVPTVSDYAGGQAVVWDFSSDNFTYFPGVGIDDFPQSTEISFEYTANVTGARPVSISWIETSGVSDVPLSWDIDTKIFKIVSTVGDTEIEAYASRCELRKMDAAIAGDYRAIGNSLMQDNYWPYNKRDTLLAESTTELSDIPNDPEDDVGDVIAAYLYWSGWIDSGFTQTIWYDNCSDLDDWTQTGSDWMSSSGRFYGHHDGGEPDRYLEMASVVDLSGYSSGSVVVEWDQSDYGYLEESDGLQFQFSGDGGTNWSELFDAFWDDTSEEYFHYVVPDEYLTSQFKMRFYVADMSGSNEYARIDDFAVAEITGTADETAVFKIDGTQVYLDGDGEPQQGVQEITATRAQVIGNRNRGEYSYACFRDVTKLVKEYAEVVDDEYHTGNAEYTVGSVEADTGTEWSYAGWSLIVVYSSPATAGHQLYLFDTFAFSGGNENLDFDGDGEPGGDISGFVVPEPIEGEENAAVMTVFVGEGDDCYDGDYFEFNGTALSDGFSTNDVWNSQSIGMSEPGVDVDTFYVTWESGLLHADDTEAHIDLPTQVDNFNLIYIILSVRSETVTGGTTHYVIRGG
jgi:hypothetical protein